MCFLWKSGIISFVSLKPYDKNFINSINVEKILIKDTFGFSGPSFQQDKTVFRLKELVDAARDAHLNAEEFSSFLDKVEDLNKKREEILQKKWWFVRIPSSLVFRISSLFSYGREGREGYFQRVRKTFSQTPDQGVNLSPSSVQKSFAQKGQESSSQEGKSTHEQGSSIEANEEARSQQVEPSEADPEEFFLENEGPLYVEEPPLGYEDALHKYCSVEKKLAKHNPFEDDFRYSDPNSIEVEKEASIFSEDDLVDREITTSKLTPEVIAEVEEVAGEQQACEAQLEALQAKYAAMPHGSTAAALIGILLNMGKKQGLSAVKEGVDGNVEVIFSSVPPPCVLPYTYLDLLFPRAGQKLDMELRGDKVSAEYICQEPLQMVFDKKINLRFNVFDDAKYKDLKGTIGASGIHVKLTGRLDLEISNKKKTSNIDDLLEVNYFVNTKKPNAGNETFLNRLQLSGWDSSTVLEKVLRGLDLLEGGEQLLTLLKGEDLPLVQHAKTEGGLGVENMQQKLNREVNARGWGAVKKAFLLGWNSYLTGSVTGLPIKKGLDEARQILLEESFFPSSFLFVSSSWLDDLGSEVSRSLEADKPGVFPKGIEGLKDKIGGEVTASKDGQSIQITFEGSRVLPVEMDVAALFPRPLGKLTGKMVFVCTSPVTFSMEQGGKVVGVRGIFLNIEEDIALNFTGPLGMKKKTYTLLEKKSERPVSRLFVEGKTIRFALQLEQKDLATLVATQNIPGLQALYEEVVPALVRGTVLSGLPQQVGACWQAAQKTSLKEIKLSSLPSLPIPFKLLDEQKKSK